jgi:transposase
MFNCLREQINVVLSQWNCLTSGGSIMTQVTARLPDKLVASIDAAARSLNCSRAEVIRQAIEYYLADVDDLRLALASLRDPSDPVLNWDDVKRDLLAAD